MRVFPAKAAELLQRRLVGRHLGRMGRTVLLLLIKEVCVLAVSVVPENSKEVTCLVRGAPRMRDL